MINRLFYIYFLVLFISCTENKKVENIQDENSYNLSNEAIYIYESEGGIVWDKKTPCKIKFCKNCEVLEVKTKFRGGISSQFYKHSFSLKLKKDTILFENWAKDDDYIINASYIDKTLIRHELSYTLFSKMSPQNIAPKCAYKHLFFNDNYEGLYIVMQEVDKSLVNINKDDSTSYLLKDGGLFISNLDQFVAQDSSNIFQIKHPKHFTEKNKKEIHNLWEFLHKSTDEEFESKVSKIFDLENVMDWHILVMLTNNGDGVIKNFYWYKKDSESKWAVVPWDYDDSFGRNGDNTIQTNESEWNRNVLISRLHQLNCDNYNSKVLEKWNKLRNEWLTNDYLESEVEKRKNYLINIKIDSNFEKWPLDGQGYIDNATFVEEINLIKSYFEKRIPFLDSTFHTWETL